jgi:hypothetical protein
MMLWVTESPNNATVTRPAGEVGTGVAGVGAGVGDIGGGGHFGCSSHPHPVLDAALRVFNPPARSNARQAAAAIRPAGRRRLRMAVLGALRRCGDR